MQLSRYAAQHPRFVQGGGGNCSAKFSGRMAVKASGYFLESVCETSGYVILDLKRGKPIHGSNGKVSMEANLHRLLNAYVIHTHPTAVAALVCSKQGKKIFKKLYPDPCCQWIDYAAPGNQLFHKVKRTLLKARTTMRKDQVLFLQNHGLFVSSLTKKRCINLHEETVQKLETLFGMASIDKLPVIPKDHYLTPDHAVYRNLEGKNLSEKTAAAVHEIETFARQALALIKKKGWEPFWLTKRDVHFLLNMKEEKYRQALWKKSR